MTGATDGRRRIDWQLEMPLFLWPVATTVVAFGTPSAMNSMPLNVARTDQFRCTRRLVPSCPGVITQSSNTALPAKNFATTGCEGMIRTIARMRGVDEQCLLPGAGSSSLIFQAFRQWLRASSRVLILDRPTASTLTSGTSGRCTVDRVNLSRDDGYQLRPHTWIRGSRMTTT